MAKQKCKYCGKTDDLITPISSSKHCCMNRNCIDKFKQEFESTYPAKKCDLCRKNKLICPTGLGKYLGENNPSLCEECKDILEPISEPTCKLIIWEITKDK